MKFKLMKTISSLRNKPILLDNTIIYTDKRSERLQFLNTLNFTIEYQSEYKSYSSYLVNDYIVCASLHYYKDKKLYYYDDNCELYNFENVSNGSTTLWKIVDDVNEQAYYFVFNLDSKQFTQRDITLSGVPFLMHDQLIFTRSAAEISSVNYVTGTTLWHFDISQFGTYADKKYINEDPIIRRREINRVYYYHNKIIVTLSRAIIALNPDNGELLWKIDFEKYDPVTLVFNENIAYSGRLIYFATIDIEKGIKLFERNFDPAFRLNIEGFILSQIRYINMTLFQNHLWFTHEENSRQFLLKANPENGDIVDGMLLETQHSTDAPIFDENRMYILDQEGYLYVYEEVK